MFLVLCFLFFSLSLLLHFTNPLSTHTNQVVDSHFGIVIVVVLWEISSRRQLASSNSMSLVDVVCIDSDQSLCYIERLVFKFTRFYIVHINVIVLYWSGKALYSDLFRERMLISVFDAVNWRKLFQIICRCHVIQNFLFMFHLPCLALHFFQGNCPLQKIICFSCVFFF